MGPMPIKGQVVFLLPQSEVNYMRMGRRGRFPPGALWGGYGSGCTTSMPGYREKPDASKVRMAVRP